MGYFELDLHGLRPRSIGVALGVTAAFFTLTMFGMTTKFNMLKAGPI